MLRYFEPRNLRFFLILRNIHAAVHDTLRLCKEF